MRGELVFEIRRLAKTKKPFTRLEVNGRHPKLSIMRVLLELHRRGELLRLSKGQSGVRGVPAVYKGK